MKEWIVYRENSHGMSLPVWNNGMRDIYEDNVFFDDSMDEIDVKRSLVDHDGYAHDICVEEAV